MRIHRTALLTLVTLMPVLAAAQAAPRVSLGILTGGNVPVGVAGDLYNAGMQLGALAEVRTPLPWLSARIDLGYRDLGARTQATTDQSGAPTGTLRARTSLLAGSADAVLRVPNARLSLQPYASAGVGRYRLHTSVSGSASGAVMTNVVRLGAGAERAVGRVKVFGEAQYERLGSGPLRVVPISVGARFAGLR